MNKTTSHLLRRTVLGIMAAIITLTGSGVTGSTVQATDVGTWSDQTEGIGTGYFEKGNSSEFFRPSCDAEGSTAQANGPETALTFPKGLDDGKMADVINAWIEEHKTPAGSILSGVGEKAVASAKNANVNPFLVISQARYESQLGNKTDYNVRHGYNSFGRSATASQPNFPAQGNAHVSLWYRWSSGEASVDYTARENQGTDSGDQYSYIRTVFDKELDAGDWDAYIEKYAPNTADGANASPIYHPADGSKSLVQQAVEEMMDQAGGKVGGNGSPSSSGAGLAGDEPEEGTFGTTAGENKRERIIVHTTEGDSSEAAMTALRQNNTSYHTLIEKDGKEIRLVKDESIAHGASDSNDGSLHVSLVGIAGDGSHFDPKSPQLQTLSKRIAKWASDYDIPIEKISGRAVLNGGDKGVAGHKDVADASPGSYAGNPRSDPGEKFPWDEVLANAKNGGATDDEPQQCCADAKASSKLSISGDTPVAKVMSYLTGKGLSVEVAAGFAGNFMQESGGGTFELDPTADNGTHRGIAQWDHAGRFGKLRQLKSGEADTIDAQIWYVGYELGLETDQGSGGYKDALDYIKQARDAEDAARRVDERYEISGGSALDKRQEFAKKALEEYGDGKISPGSNSNSDSSGCDKAAKAAGDFVYYNQNDPKWQGEGYDIALAGCGPTSIAMIIASKKDKTVTPVDVTKFLSEEGMWAEAGGIQWTGFAAAGEKWGMKVTDIGKDWNKAKEALKAGKFMTLSGTGSAPFTSGGHIIVARGITDDDKIIIANSAPMNDTPEETPYTTAELDGAGFANMWVFE